MIKKIAATVVILLCWFSVSFATNFEREHFHNYMASVNENIPEQDKQRIITAVLDASKIYKIDYKLILGLIAIESSFDKECLSKGNYGLMQIRYSVWNDELKKNKIIKVKKDLLSIRQNIMAGTYILRYYYDEGIQKKAKDPMRYAFRRYSGGSSTHIKKVKNEIKIFNQFIAAKNEALS